MLKKKCYSTGIVMLQKTENTNKKWDTKILGMTIFLESEEE